MHTPSPSESTEPAVPPQEQGKPESPQPVPQQPPEPQPSIDVEYLAELLVCGLRDFNNGIVNLQTALHGSSETISMPYLLERYKELNAKVERILSAVTEATNGIEELRKKHHDVCVYLRDQIKPEAKRANKNDVCT